jgi:hypothetical protein
MLYHIFTLSLFRKLEHYAWLDCILLFIFWVIGCLWSLFIKLSFACRGTMYESCLLLLKMNCPLPFLQCFFLTLIYCIIFLYLLPPLIVISCVKCGWILRGSEWGKCKTKACAQYLIHMAASVIITCCNHVNCIKIEHGGDCWFLSTTFKEK